MPRNVNTSVQRSYAQPRRPFRRLLVSLVIGVAFALATSVANYAAAEYAHAEHAERTLVASVARIASYLLDAGWSWAALAVAVGWLTRTPLLGAAAGAIALVGATAEYYVFKSWPLFTADGAFYLDSRVLFWGAFSLLVGPLLGAAGAYIRHGGWVGLLAGLTVPVGAAVQMLVMPVGIDRTSTVDGSVLPEGEWARWIVWVAAALGATYVAMRLLQEQKRNSQPATGLARRNSRPLTASRR